MPSSTLPAADPRHGFNAVPERRSLWIPWLFVGSMLVVIAVNALMIFYAEDTFSGLDTEQYYQEGIAYNSILKEAAASKALGWTSRIELAPLDHDADHNRQLRLRLADRTGAPLGDLKVTVHLVRPVSTAFDQLLDLAPSPREPGLYTADLHLPAAGNWELRITAEGGSAPWQKTQRIFVK